jgi:hypothetical protein
VLALLQRAEARSPYDDERDATPQMAADERIHEEVVRSLAIRGRNRISGTFRAAVFGANDGLVSNLALILGVGAAGVGALAQRAHVGELDRDAGVGRHVVEEDARLGRQRVQQRGVVADDAVALGREVRRRRDEHAGHAALDGEPAERDRLGQRRRARPGDERDAAGVRREPLDHRPALVQ